MASELSLDVFLFGQRCRGIYSTIKLIVFIKALVRTTVFMMSER